MKESISLKLESVRDRFEEIAGLLADPDVIADQNGFVAYQKNTLALSRGRAVSRVSGSGWRHRRG